MVPTENVQIEVLMIASSKRSRSIDFFVKVFFIVYNHNGKEKVIRTNTFVSSGKF